VFGVVSSACVLDIALVLDHSSSVGNNSWQNMINAVADFFSLVEIGNHATHVGAVSFGE